VAIIVDLTTLAGRSAGFGERLRLEAIDHEPHEPHERATALPHPNVVIPESRAADSSGISSVQFVEVDPGQLAGVSFRDDIEFERKTELSWCFSWFKLDLTAQS